MGAGDYPPSLATTGAAQIEAFHEQLAAEFAADQERNNVINLRASDIADVISRVWFKDAAPDYDAQASVFESVKQLLWMFTGTDPSDDTDQPYLDDMGTLVETL